MAQWEVERCNWWPSGPPCDGVAGHGPRHGASLAPVMVAALKYLRSPALRPALAALLMLHVGTFQSGAGHAGMASVGGATAHVVAHSAMAAPTCHIAAGEIHFRHVPCCTAGECQCAACCYQGDALAKVVAGPFARGIEPSFSDPTTPPPQLARQLRPPIAL